LLYTSLVGTTKSYIKVSTGALGLLALSQDNFYPYGDNSFGALGFAQSYTNSRNENIKSGVPINVILSNAGVIGAYDIAAGGNHSVILASNIKPSGQSFTIIRPDGYPIITNLTIYPTTQIVG
jgi:alpha-tubulin suppressor-like RCC1 family protein